MNSKKARAKGISRTVVLACLLSAVFPPTTPEAQQPKKMARIGYLSAYSGPPGSLVAFKEALTELAWIEGRNITFEYRYGGGRGDKYSDFATELVHLNVDVIVAGPGNGASRAAKQATSEIPIVMGNASDDRVR